MNEACKKCVQYPGEKYTCPAWIGAEAGYMETNVQTGEDRLVTGCFYQVMPKLMIHVVKASNRPAAAMQDLRNKLATAMEAQALAYSNGAPLQLKK